MSQVSADLSRNLQGRHIQLIALGGTIGVGLFLGSAKAIHHAGPGLLLSYAIGGIVIFFVMRALGELLIYRPVAGSFAVYADEFCGPFAGFATGWSYWFMWVVTAMAELTAIGIYLRYWFPDMPQWLPALVTLVILYGTNQLAVRIFGELEFWFALIKIVTIVALILGGLRVISKKSGSFVPAPQALQRGTALVEHPGVEAVVIRIHRRTFAAGCFGHGIVSDGNDALVLQLVIQQI